MILISDQNAMGAAEWCQQHLPEDSWQMVSRWPGSGVIFKISDQQIATLFRLIWI